MSFFAMAEGFYKLWYKEKVSMNLTNEQKIDIAKQRTINTTRNPKLIMANDPTILEIEVLEN